MLLYPDIQRKAQQEVDRVVGRDRLPDFSDEPSLPYVTALVKEVRPLLEEAEKILNETRGSIKGADPQEEVSKKAMRNQEQHKATPSEQRLADALVEVSPSVLDTCSMNG